MRSPSPPHSDRDTIAELQEKVRQLEELLAPTDVAFPAKWELTPTEALVLSCLIAGDEGYRTKEQLLHVITEHSPREDIGAQNVSTRIFKLRRKLKPWNIYIETRHGLGFQLTVPSLMALRALHKASKEALAVLVER
jgi:two-component system cell cycle response regulator CtrA